MTAAVGASRPVPSNEVRVVDCRGFGTFIYDPEADRYEWDDDAIKLLAGTVGEHTTYSEVMRHIPRSLHKEYEQWRVETIESGRPGSARIPFQLPGRLLILQILLHRIGKKVHGVLLDVTLDETAYQATRAQLRVMAFAERIASFGTWAYDLPADSFMASEGAVNLLLPGADPESFTFDKVLDLVHSDHRDALRKAHERALATGQVQHVEFRLADEDRWFVILFMRVMDADGNPVRTCGTIHETTDLHVSSEVKRESERLSSLEAIRARFVNAAAHELSQPLTPMRLQLALVARMVPEKEDVLRALRVVQRNVERLDFMLRDLLDAARSQAGRLKVDLRPTDLTAQLSHVVETLRPLADQRHVRLEWNPVPLPMVLADSMRVQQCLSNLIHNAIKFTKEGTPVIVQTDVEGGRVKVHVRDQGPGLSESQQALLFQPFQQIHASPSGFPSTGLGLYVSKALMDAMHGTIGLASRPGEGSTFTLELPVAKPE